MQNLECLPCSANLFLASCFCPYTTFFLPPLTRFFSPTEGAWPISARDPCPGGNPRDRLESPWFELAVRVPTLNSFEPTLLKPLAIEEMGGNTIEGDMWKGAGGGCSSAYHALGLGNCFWGNILMQHWQSVLEYCKSMSSSCECFSNMSIPSHFVSSYCPMLIKYCLSDGIPAAKVL